MTEPARASFIWTLRLIGAWALVLIPLAWGVYETATTTLVLLR